jgi:uncharacterized protein DUF3540
VATHLLSRRGHAGSDGGNVNNLARKLEDDLVFQYVGAVARVRGDAIVIRTATSEVEARRGASCLLEPRAGDRVLVCEHGVERYVLAILTREDEGRSTLAVDGDVEVRVRSGRFVVAAQEGVEIVSGKDVSVVSGTLDVNAVDGNVALRRLTFVGTLVQAEIEKIKLLAERLDSVVERVAQRVKRSYRTVEETDQVKAERIDYAAKKTMSLHAENALVTAEELVKIDGEQIHVG